MSSMRTKHAPIFKAKVALEVFKEEKTLAELAGLYHVHPGLIRNWKNLLIKGAPNIFNGNGQFEDNDQVKLTEELYRHIGRLNAVFNFFQIKWKYQKRRVD